MIQPIDQMTRTFKDKANFDLQNENIARPLSFTQPGPLLNCIFISSGDTVRILGTEATSNYSEKSDLQTQDLSLPK